MDHSPSLPTQPSAARARGNRLDHATAALLHLVMSPGWTPEQAAQRLRRRVHDDRLLLRLLFARVSRAMLDRPTAIDARAHATLTHALDPHALAPDGSPGRAPATGAPR
jgi:hypothetical protein